MHAIVVGFHAGIVLAICSVINRNGRAEGSTSGPVSVGIRCFTTSNYVYEDTGVYLDTSTFVFFCVKACSDIYVLLTESADNFLMNAYEIGIGSGSNTYCFIKQGKQGATLADEDAAAVLNCNECVYIWILWSDQKLEVGKGNVIGENILVAYQWTTPTAIYYMFLASYPEAAWSIPESLYPGVPVGGSQGNCLTHVPDETVIPVVMDLTTGDGTSVWTTIQQYSTQQEDTTSTVIVEDTTSIQVTTSDATSTPVIVEDTTSIPVTTSDATSTPVIVEDTTSIQVTTSDATTSNLITQTSDPGVSSDPTSNLAVRTYFITEQTELTTTVPVTTSELLSTVTTVNDQTLVEDITTEPNPITASSTQTAVTNSQQMARCRLLPDIARGILAKTIVDNFRKIIVAIYTCRTGYRFPSGGTSRSIVCTNGLWSANISNCESISCAARKTNSSNEKGIISYSSRLKFGDVLLSVCEKPRCFQDAWIYESVKCLSSSGVKGVLSRQQSLCQVCRCEPPRWVENATVLFNMTSGWLKVTCIHGHRFDNGLASMTFTCNSVGSWMRIKSCNELYCSKLEPPLHGSLSTDAVIFDTTVIVSCDPGFAFPNGNLTEALHCLESLWDDTVKDCLAVFCARPSFPFENARMLNTVTSDRLPYATILTYVCYEGQKFENGYRIKQSECVGAGYWNDTDMSCGFNRCDPVPQLRNGKSDSFKALQGSVATYTCDAGFAFSNNQPFQDIVCDGQTWNPPLNDCLVITCPGSNVSNAKWIGDDLHWNSTANVQCDLGYHISGRSNVSIYCGKFGNWSDDVTSCEPVDCGPPPEINSSESRIWSSTTYSSAVTFYCPSGLWFSRYVFSRTMICEADGHWHVVPHVEKQELPKCVDVNCPPLYDHLANTTETEVGVNVQVTCSGNQTLQTGQTEAMAICTRVGLWSPAIPECIGGGKLQKVEFPKVEAKGAQYVAAASATLVASMMFVIVLLDAMRLVAMFRKRHAKHQAKNKFK